MTPPTGDGDRLADLLSTLLGKVSAAPIVPEARHEEIEPLVHMVIYSFMLWESTPKQAARALASLCKHIIDPNELRVALPEEIAEWAGTDDKAAMVRADRLRAALNGIYASEHKVSLASLETMAKRDARSFLEGLDGVPPFVASRVTLFGLGGHAVPVDQWLYDQFVAEEVITQAVPIADAERWLERQIRASDVEQIVRVLEGWRDAGTGRKGRARSGAKTGTKSGAKGAKNRAAKKAQAKKSKKGS